MPEYICSIKPKRKRFLGGGYLFTIALVFVGIFAFGDYLFSTVFASDSPWDQTDWSGGSTAGEVTDTVTTFSGASNIRFNNAGQITLEDANAKIASLKGNQLSTGSTNFNTGSMTAIKFNTEQIYNNSYFSYSGSNATRLVVDEDGDYFVAFTLNYETNGVQADPRSNLIGEIRVNGTKVDVGQMRGTYVRNYSGHFEGTGNLNVLLEDLSTDDYIELYIQRTTSDSSRPYTGNLTLFAEKIEDTETVFSGTSTRTVASTNLNSSESAMQWTESREDSGFTHDNSSSSHNITINDAGEYFVTVNIPLGSTVSRGNIYGRVMLDGVEVTGGEFKQGYLRNTNNHYDASIHWAGMVKTTSENQVLTVTAAQEAAGGTITTDSEKATIFIRKLPSTDWFFSSATQAGGQNNWNPSSEQNINWSSDEAGNDTDVFTHDTVTDNHEITVEEDGDYILSFNAGFTGSVQRGSPEIKIKVNGTPVTYATTRSAYMRASSGHNDGSTMFTFPLFGLEADDVITLTTIQEGYSGTVNDTDPAIVLLQKKGQPEFGYLISNIFDAEFPADWGEITYNTSGSGTVTVKARTDDDSDFSDAEDWANCTALTSGDDLADTDTTCISDTTQYIQYRIDLEPDGLNSPVFEDISLAFTASDNEAPPINASSITLDNATDGDWTNIEPTISWTAGSDDVGGLGILGYCIALDEAEFGSSDTLDPTTSSGALAGIDDGVDSAACPYVVTGTSVDLSAIPGLTLTSNKQFYFSIKAVDLNDNVWTGSAGNFQDLVSFKYDGTKPTNVTFVSTPSSVFGNVDDMFFTWPISGGSAASDNESGLIGWQYSINSDSNWTGPDTHPTLGIDYIEDDGNTSEVYLQDAVDGSAVIEGNNTIYFRAVDLAGNGSTYVTGGLNFGGDAPTFAAESVVSISPSTSTSNSFSVSWPEADANNGGSIDSYYWMLNVSPPATISTLTGNSTVYKPVTATNLATGKITGAVKGTNTIYVVAVDDEENYSQSNAISGTFNLNSTKPDPPKNLLATDASIKSEELWRVSLTWEEPAYAGNGNLSYKIQRSTNNSTWTDVKTTTERSYTDTVAISQTYYYRIGTVDTSSESIADPSYATSVSVLPKGSYTEPPTLTDDPEVSSITTKRATISWSTSRSSDSKVQFGTSSGDYNDEEPSNSDQVTSHEINLTNLDPGTKYYYKVKWTDEDGNTGTSDEETFSTEPAPTVSGVSPVNVGINSVGIKFTVEDAHSAKIYYGKTSNFGGVESISTSTNETTYTVTLDGLEDGTLYQYKINTFDEEDEEYEGTTLEFETLPRPRITNVRVQQVRGTAQPTILITWNTNTEISSIITYYPLGDTAATRDEVNVNLISGEHRMLVRGLLPNTQYNMIVKGRDKAGNEAISDQQTITTASDTRPPLISELKTEGSIVNTTGGEKLAQLVVSWDTDEPGTSQVEFGEGTGTTYSQATQEDSDLTYNHVVVISNLTPSKVYHLRAVSKDEAGNVQESIDTVTITPKATDDALNLVISNLQATFGFIGGN